MNRKLRKGISIFQDGGVSSLIRRVGYETLQKISWSLVQPETQHINFQQSVFSDNNINLCIGDAATQEYDNSLKNVFIAIEAPDVVRRRGWIDDSLEYDAEISFGDFYGLDQYFCPRELYASFDYFVPLRPNEAFSQKDSLASMIFSSKSELQGHQLRHTVAEEFDGQLDLYGSGAGNRVEDKHISLDEYMFQVVIENDRHPNFVSEKFFDCIKTNTIPIYWGGKSSVKKLGFNTDSVLFFEDLDSLAEILSTKVSDEVYTELRPAVEENRQRLVELRNRTRFNLYSSPYYFQFTHTEGQGNHDNLWIEEL